MKRDFTTALDRMSGMLQAASDLLSKEILLPQTTSLQKAEEATQEYRDQLEATKKEIIKEIEIEYNVCVAISHFSNHR